MPKASYLALDLASVTGFALWRDGMERAEYGSVKFDAPELADRAIQFVDWILPKVAAHDVTDVACEALVPVIGTTSLDSLVWLHGMFWRISEICARRKIRLHPVGVAAWRSFFLGVTRAPKSITDRNKRRVWLKRRCVDECKARGMNPKNDNEADAIAVLTYVRAMNDESYMRQSGKPRLLGEAA